jgi:hypothetical protein
MDGESGGFCSNQKAGEGDILRTNIKATRRRTPLRIFYANKKQKTIDRKQVAKTIEETGEGKTFKFDEITRKKLSEEPGSRISNHQLACAMQHLFRLVVGFIFFVWIKRKFFLYFPLFFDDISGYDFRLNKQARRSKQKKEQVNESTSTKESSNETISGVGCLLK